MSVLREHLETARITGNFLDFVIRECFPVGFNVKVSVQNSAAHNSGLNSVEIFVKNHPFLERLLNEYSDEFGCANYVPIDKAEEALKAYSVYLANNQ